MVKTKAMKKMILLSLFVSLLLSACNTNQPQIQLIQTPTVTPPAVRVGFVVSEKEAAILSDAGIQSVREQLGNGQVLIEDTSGKGVEQTVDQLVNSGCNIIFSLSQEVAPAIAIAASSYPDILFAQYRGDDLEASLVSFDVRQYEGRYLTGLAAGQTTQSRLIGYIAPHAQPDVIRSINAFALGVKKTNADAQIHVGWSNGSSDDGVSIALEEAERLIKMGCDVIVCHESIKEMMDIAKANGCFVVGGPNYQPTSEDAQLISAPIYDFETYYASVIQAVGAGTAVIDDFWGGVAQGTVKLPLSGEAMSLESQAKVQEQYDALAAGALSIFEGPVYNQYGLIMVPEGVTLEDEDLRYMLWFVDNVVGEIPQG